MKIQMSDAFKRFSEDVRALNPELFGPAPIPTHAQLNQAAPEDERADKPRRSKFGNIRTAIGDEKFDSKGEADRWLVLKAQLEAGEIDSLMRQVRIQLLEGFTYQGEKVRPIHYTADFVWTKEGKTYIEDFKSVATMKTVDFRIRWRMLQHLYKDRDDVICLTTGH